LASLKEHIGLQSMEDGFVDFWSLKDYFLKNRHSGFRIKGKCEECGSKLTSEIEEANEENCEKRKKKDWVIKQRKYGRMGNLKVK
jgi:hypothetical protein